MDLYETPMYFRYFDYVSNIMLYYVLKILIFCQTLCWQKRESPPVGFKPNASCLPDKCPTARPQRIPVLPITYPSDYCEVTGLWPILFTRRHLHIPSMHVLPLHICSTHLSGWPTIISVWKNINIFNTKKTLENSLFRWW